MVEEANKKQRIRTGHPLIDDSNVRKLCHSEQTTTIWYMRENLMAIGVRAHTVLQCERDLEMYPEPEWMQTLSLGKDN